MVAGAESDPQTQAMIKEVYRRFLPNKVVALHPPEGQMAEKIRALTPFIENQLPVDGKPTAYVCKNYICDYPTTDLTELRKLLDKR